jgi:mRNA interferase HigB
LVRVIAGKTLTRFVESLRGRKGQPALKAALDSCFKKSDERRANPADLRRSFGAAIIVSAERVAFNIKGGTTIVWWRRSIMAVRSCSSGWVGAHADYDRIDARSVQYGD